MTLELDTRQRETSARDFDAELDGAIGAACRALIGQQRDDGHWLYELEADATIPAEYVLMRHFRGEPVDAELERKIAVYLRRIQGEHGGWPLFHGGAFDMSASVKAYFALKTIGDAPHEPHMRRAREAILKRGGAVHCNVFTRILLALYDIMSWRSVPVMPVEIVLLPRWFPFHLSKVSYWARTVMVPLLVLQALKPRAKNPRGITLDELFSEPPRDVGLAAKAPHQSWTWFILFRAIDAILRPGEKLIPESMRRRAIDKAAAFVSERLNGQDGLGAIFPAMVNATLMFDALGGAENEKKAAVARDSVERLLVVKRDEAYCQPCLSPIWDTALACQALLEAGGEGATAARKGLAWMNPLQVLDVDGDWIARRPSLRPGGWAFQYANPHYPDLDDTAVIVMAMDRARANGDAVFDVPIARAEEWVRGMQSRNGGWAAFDVDNIYDYLNNIPFADHGALIDPPTEDVAARCVSMLAQLGDTLDQSAALKRGVDYLLSRQTAEGSWYGRWGVNYIYGTWSVLCALNAAGVRHTAPEIRRAVSWLIAIQNPDGGWGEDGASYRLDYRGHEPAPSTASQTAWALLGLMAAGECDHPAVVRGVRYLLTTQETDGQWREEHFTGGGFPRVFYLRYHGYAKYFPLWALARYRNLRAGNSRKVEYGM
ncbi:MAG TPA: squalene--hopene cyclase [Pseudolabrys sp.]|nr:squalene--hopene cyclase [Pseudolabrys sp.]